MIREIAVEVKTFCIDTATFSSVMGIILYWVPVAICAIGYTIRTLVSCSSDYQNRKDYESGKNISYYPTETIVAIIGRALVCFIPIANLWISILDFGSTYLRNIFIVIEKIFCQPIVPARRKQK